MEGKGENTLRIMPKAVSKREKLQKMLGLQNPILPF